MNELNKLRQTIYEHYEFWLGCYEQSVGNDWQSGAVHAYRNTLHEIDRLSGVEKEPFGFVCPCHVCKAKEKR